MFKIIAKKALLFAIQYIPYWKIIDWVVSLLRKFVLETTNKVDDKVLDTLEYVLDGIKKGDFSLGIDEWLKRKLKEKDVNIEKLD